MMDRLRISSSHSRVSSPSLTIYPIHRNFTSNRTSFIIERRFASIVHRDDTRRFSILQHVRVDESSSPHVVSQICAQ